MRWLISIGSLALGLGALGCTVTRAATFDPAAVEGPTRAAQQMGAADVPDAALYLSFSHDELERARQLSNAGDTERSAAMTARAQADAELALAVTKRAVAEREAVQANQMQNR